MSGFFISFEGIDKSGKSTQAKRLVTYLKEKGREVVFTHEPGGTELGQELRRLALTWKPQKSSAPVDPTAEMFIFAADRAQHVAEIIRPALNQGNVVITDRYLDSTLAYQGYGRGLDVDRLHAIQKIATGGLLPHLTIWVDVNLATSRSRYGQEEADRMESQDDGAFERVRAGFEKLAQASPNRFFRVDGSLPMDDVFDKIKLVVDQKLP